MCCQRRVFSSLDGPEPAYHMNWWCSESPATFQIEMKIDCIHQQILLSRDVTKVQLLDSFLSPKWNKWCSESPTTFESGMKIYHIFYCHYHQFHQRHNFLSWLWQGLWRLCDCPHHHQYPHHHYYNHQERQHHHNHHHQDAHLYVKVHPLLVGLDDVAPVEEVVVVHHAPREVRLAQHLREVRSVGKIFFEIIRNSQNQKYRICQYLR